MKNTSLAVALAGVLGLFGGLAAGCGDDSGNGPGEVDGGTDDLGGDGGGLPTELVPVKMSGQVIAFEDDKPLAGSVTVSTLGLTPAPQVTITGADFELTQVTPFSVFSILAGSPPDYRTTYNVAPAVQIADVTGVKAYVVAEATLVALQTAFGVAPAAGKAIVMAHLVSPAGAPVAGVPAAALQLNGAAPVNGPRFLDAAKAAAVGATMSSASGWAIFYDVDPGLVQITTPAASGYTISSAQAPSSGGLVTVVEAVTATGSATMLPTNVSFANQVMPIFTSRGCILCHSGNGPGKDLGGLQFNGGAAKVYTEVTTEISPNTGTLRVDTAMPDKSLLLTRPSAESPPDVHPTVVFPNSTDADYLKILVWIKEGAKNN